MKTKRSLALLSCLGLLATQCCFLIAGCDHGIEPPVSDWLDTGRDDVSIDPPEPAEQTDPEKDTQATNETTNPEEQPWASDTDSNEVDSGPEDSDAKEPMDSEDRDVETADPLDTQDSPDSAEADTLLDSENPQNPRICLLISEYIEGSSKNKAVEVLNCGDEALSLEGISLCTVFNGESECGKTLELADAMPQGERLEPWSVLTICYSGIEPAFAGLCDHTHALAYFNGDDRLVLQHENDVLDAFGQPGLPPEGTPWKDATYRRCNLSAYKGAGSFEVKKFYSEHNIDDFSDFGLPPHQTANCPTE
jgi:hypothetical protein